MNISPGSIMSLIVMSPLGDMTTVVVVVEELLEINVMWKYYSQSDALH